MRCMNIVSFFVSCVTVALVKFRRAPVRYLCSLLLICAGATGILFSPSIGLLGGTELRSFTLSEAREYPWGTAISHSETELPFIQNQRGLFFMNLFLAGSLGALFGGVHWFAGLRNKPVLVGE
jgi:hypothetical protein